MSKIFLINTGKTQYIEGSLKWVTNGSNMFQSCINLTSFSSDLSNLTNGTYMFQGCDNLTTFSSDLSSLTDGTGMFQNCTKLTTFSTDLSSLTNGSNMFSSCSNLTSFSADLSSLTNAGSGYSLMFGNSIYNCTKLDLASVQNIADTINDLASQGKTGTLSIGMAKALQSDDETAPVNVALAAIRAKGWTVTEVYA